MIPVINQIENAVKDVPGWSPLEQLFALYTLAFSSAHLDGDVLELGSWCGRSAAAFGLAARHSGAGKVNCIDLFPRRSDWYRNADGTYSISMQLDGKTICSYNQQTVWAEAFEKDLAPFYEKHEDVFSVFSETVLRNGLQGIVIPFRGDFEMFLASVHVSPRYRLVFIDAHHSYEAVCNDIRLAEEYLLPGGWICFDDAFSGYDGVDRAIFDRIIKSGLYEKGCQMTRKLFVARKTKSH